jgi:Dyp-type peroxidase family
MVSEAFMTEKLELSEIQGLIVTGYGERPAARYALFEVTDAALARKFVASLEAKIQFSEYRAAPRNEPPFLQPVCINLAFTHEGLVALGLGRETLLGFSHAFQEGANDENRARRMGDDGASAPENWVWGKPGQKLHGLLLVFAGKDDPSPDDYQTIQKTIDDLCAPSNGVRIVQVLDTMPANRVLRKEHFGFRDGITNPRFAAFPHDDDPGIADGEFLLGYENAYGRVNLSPEVPEGRDRGRLLPPATLRSDHRDFGRNGSYLVFRQLEQKVPQFWQFVHQAKDGVPDAPKGPAGDEWLAAKFVGRWRNGTPLTLYPDGPGPDKAGDRDDFLFAPNDDAYGARCPIGAHIRRTHPRDTGLPVPHDPELSRPPTGDPVTLRLDLANRHRIMRRGRSYGEPLDPNYDPEVLRQFPPTDQDERGIHFLCFNANLSRQFEFVQSNWAGNPAFGGLSADPDPLLSVGRKYPYPADDFTVQGCPTRRVRGLPRVVETRGGAYFFMPSRSALRYLGSL